MDPSPRPERLSLSTYPFHHEIRARFADVDSFGHLNNVAVASYYEDARAVFNRSELGDVTLAREQGSHFVVARTLIHYLAEARYPGAYQVGLGISRIGTSSLVYSTGLFRDAVCVGLCDAVMVHLTHEGPTPLPPEVREVLERRAFPAAMAL